MGSHVSSGAGSVSSHRGQQQQQHQHARRRTRHSAAATHASWPRKRPAAKTECIYTPRGSWWDVRGTRGAQARTHSGRRAANKETTQNQQGRTCTPRAQPPQQQRQSPVRATSVAGRAGWKQLARPLFAEHLTSIHGRDVLCHKTVVSGFFISGSTYTEQKRNNSTGCVGTAAAAARKALGPRECADRATVGGPRHNSNVGRVRGRGGRKKRKEQPRERKREGAGNAGSQRASRAISAGLCLGVLRGDLMVKQLCITRAQQPRLPWRPQQKNKKHKHTNTQPHRTHHQPRKVISKLNAHQRNKSARFGP